METLPDQAISQALKILLRQFQTTALHGSSAAPHLDKREVTPDIAPWEKLGSDADRLERVLNAFYKRVSHQIKELRLRQNAMMPIDRLPPEVLSSIFMFVSEENYVQSEDHEITRQNYRSIYINNVSISQVCSRWHSITLSIPQLWVHLHSSFHPNIIEALLERSKQSPLHIAVGEGPIHQELEFIRSIHQCISRWKVFQSWSSVTGYASFRYMADQSAPLLERFSILSRQRSTAGQKDGLPSRYFNDDASRLRHLHINSLELYCLDSRVLSALTTLRFTAEIDGVPFTPDQFSALFSSSPNLEDIHINGWSAEVQAAHQFATSEIFLPRLKSLRLDHLPDTTIGFLISSISTTKNSYPNLNIREPARPGRLAAIFPESPRDGSLLAIIRTMTWLFAIDDDDPSLEGAIYVGAGVHVSGVRRTLLTLTGMVESPTSNLFDTLLSPHSRSGLKDIRVVGEELFETNSFIRNLRFYRNLEVLKLWRPDWSEIGEDGPLAIDFLSEEVSGCLQAMDVEGNPTWPCPKLRYLSLGGPIHIQPIVNIVAARFSKPEAKGLKALEIGYLGEMDPTQTEPEVVDQLLELLNTKNGLLYTTKMDDVESPIYKMLELPNESALELSPSD